MSVVVGFVDGDDVYLASDSQSSAGNGRIEMVGSKVFRCGSVFAGFVGTMRVSQLLYSFLQPSVVGDDEPLDFLLRSFVPAAQEILRDHGYLHVEDGVTRIADDCEGLVVVNRRLFHFCNDFQIIEREGGFDAVGSGADLSLGAIEALKGYGLSGDDLVKTAVQTAIALDIYCGGRVTVWKVKDE